MVPAPTHTCFRPAHLRKREYFSPAVLADDATTGLRGGRAARVGRQPANMTSQKFCPARSRSITTRLPELTIKGRFLVIGATHGMYMACTGKQLQPTSTGTASW